MVHPLDNARRQIDRGHEHTETIRQEAALLRQLEPQPGASDKDPQTRDKIIYLAVGSEFPPGRWGVIAGEAANAFRAALDYLVAQLVIVSGKTPVKANQFPIYPFIAEYNLNRDRVLTGVRADLKLRFDAMQPLQPNGASNWQPLLLLQWMTNLGKHIDLHPTVALADRQKARIEFVEPSAGGTIEIDWTARNSQPVVNGTELFRIRTRPDPDAKVKVHGSLTSLITFGERHIGMNDLKSIEVEVRRIVESFVDVFPA